MPDPALIEVRSRAAVRSANTLFGAMKDGDPEPIEAARIVHMGAITALDAALNEADDGA